MTIDVWPHLSQDKYVNTDKADLLLLADFIIIATPVCVPWTCSGMLQVLEGTRGKHIALDVHGKQKIRKPDYTIVAFGCYGKTSH